MACTYANAGNTDVSSIDNVVYITPFTVSSGTQTSLSIQMKNTALIRSFQFDLYLPDGVSVVKSSKGRIQGSLSQSRLPDEDQHLLTFSEQPDGAIRFLCGSEYDENFTGSDGEIATLQIDVSADMSAGDYPVYIKNITLSETDIKNHYDTELVESTITIGTPADTRTVLDETSTTVPEAATGVDVRVKRTIKANEWSTICLPFAMTEAQVLAAFGDDVQLADFTGCSVDDETDDITVNFTYVTAIEANHPYIIKVSEAVTEFTVDGVDIAPEDDPCVDRDEETTGSGRNKKTTYNSFIGTYVAETVVPDYALFLSDNQFWFSTGNTRMKAFRAYFDLATAGAEYEDAEAAARVFMAFDEAITTGIGGLTPACSKGEGVHYNLKGQRVAAPSKGLYVVDGKKVVLK